MARQHPAFPDICTRPAPVFLADKYKTVTGLLRENEPFATADGLPSLDTAKLAARFSTFDDLFRATATEIEQSTGLPQKEAEGYRKIIQRLLLWADVREVTKTLSSLFDHVISELPQTLVDLEEAGGGRDILDPFIVAFASRLLHSGDVESLVRTLVSHKCLMKLEDMIGHIHQAVLGRAAGGEWIPEPQGVKDAAGRKNKEDWHETLNPYPGADARRGIEEFYQIKNKTGSAKGSDGEKLARQFLILKAKYPTCKRFYVSMVGRTLAGHRSMGAFLRTDPGAVVLVGLAAFQQLGRHRDTAEIVMELYLDEFDKALSRNHYDFDSVVAGIATEWTAKHGEDDPAFDQLRDSITPSDSNNQSSTTYYKRGQS